MGVGAGRAGGWPEAQGSVLGEIGARTVSCPGKSRQPAASEVGRLTVEDGSPCVKGSSVGTAVLQRNGGRRAPSLRPRVLGPGGLAQRQNTPRLGLVGSPGCMASANWTEALALFFEAILVQEAFASPTPGCPWRPPPRTVGRTPIGPVLSD